MPDMDAAVAEAWIGVIGVAAGGVIGVGGSWLGALMNKRSAAATTAATIAANSNDMRAQIQASEAATKAQIDSALATVNAQIEADRQAKRLDRLHDVYTELGNYLSRHADWAKSVQPFMGPVAPPDPMPAQDRWKVETLVIMYGSAEVRQLLEEYNDRTRRVEQADIVIKSASTPTVSAELDATALQERRSLPEHREAMRTAEDAVRAQMSLELAGSKPAVATDADMAALA